CLHRVFARRKIFETSDRITLCRGVHKLSLSCCPAINGDAKHDLRAGGVVNLEARLDAGVGGEQQKETSIKRLRTEVLRIGDREGLCRKAPGGKAENQSQSQT